MAKSSGITLNPLVIIIFTVSLRPNFLAVNSSSDVEINVIDLTGKIVEKLYSGKLSSGKHYYQWNAGKYNSGIYLMRVKIDDQMCQKRLVVDKN